MARHSHDSGLLAGAALVLTLAACSDTSPAAPDSHSLAPAAPRADVYAATVSGTSTLVPLFGSAFGNIASGINDAGDVVGITSDNQVATLWATGVDVAPASTTPLAIAGGATRGMDINLAGQIVGYLADRAALWTPNGGGYTRTDIQSALEGRYGPVLHSVANGINARGQVAGTYTQSGPVMRCFLWTPSTPNGTSGTVEDLGDLTGVVVGEGGARGECIANDINSLGHVAGASTASLSNPPVSHAFVWSGSGLVDLAPAGGASYGTAINDGGQVAGWRITSSSVGGVYNAAVWTPVGVGAWSVVDLGAPALSGQQSGPNLRSQAMDLNDAGFVVGFTDDLNGAVRAFFWQNGRLTELPAGGAPTVSASALSNLVGDVVVVAGASIVDPTTNARDALRWAVRLMPATPQGCIGSLVALIGQLQADGTLRAGEAKSLLAKLDAATRQLDQGRTTPAANLLEAFIDEVSAAVAAGRLSAAEAQPLIDGARCALAAL